jgi:hypothetical protein
MGKDEAADTLINELGETYEKESQWHFATYAIRIEYRIFV